jgi:membrane AbrB-like protein
MGRAVTIGTVHAILAQFPLMIAATLITVGAGVLTAWLMFRHTTINFTSCLLGCVPGGLSQMVILAAEMKDTDLTAVTIMQTLRMLSVVFVIPFLTINVISGGGSAAAAAAAAAQDVPTETVLKFAAIAIASAFLGKKLHLPTPTLLGPVIGTGAYLVWSGGTAPVVPPFWLDTAQLFVGAYIGSCIDLQKIKSYHGMGPILLFGVLLVLAVSMAPGFFISRFTGIDLATAFLSTAPGGLSEMGIAALVVGADAGTMTAYQLTRVLFIMGIFPYLARLIVAFYNRRTGAHDR